MQQNDTAGFTLHDAAAARTVPDLMDVWALRLQDSDNPDALFQTPAWLQTLADSKPHGVLKVGCLRDQSGQVLGVAPLAIGGGELRFSIGPKVLGRVRLRAAYLMGNEPLLPPDAAYHDQLFLALEGALPQVQALFLNLRLDSFCGQHVLTSRTIRQSYTVYIQQREQLNLLDLPPTFRRYTARFTSKRNYNLRRQIRLGEFRLWGAVGPADVAGFLRAAGIVAGRSWQNAYDDEPLADNAGWLRFLTKLATLGLFRSYILYSGDTPCAYQLGYHYQGVYEWHFPKP